MTRVERSGRARWPSLTRSGRNRPPLVLVSADIESQGKEFEDLSLSLSVRYQTALLAAGGLPVVCPATVDPGWAAECVARSDGLLLTGGDDVDPRLYATRLPPGVRRTLHVTPDGGGRDFRELLLINEVFRQRKPLLAICRGQQILNVALGGTLIPDIASAVRGAIAHRRMDRRCQIVHEVRLTPGSLLAKIAARQELGVNSTHHQAVGRVAPALQVTARSADNVIEALELKADAAAALPFLLSVQFHPERLADRYAEHGDIFRAFVRACALSRNNNL